MNFTSKTCHFLLNFHCPLGKRPVVEIVEAIFLDNLQKALISNSFPHKNHMLRIWNPIKMCSLQTSPTKENQIYILSCNKLSVNARIYSSGLSDRQSRINTITSTQTSILIKHHLHHMKIMIPASITTSQRSYRLEMLQTNLFTTLNYLHGQKGRVR